MQGLTKRQQMVLDYITHSISDRGYPPTLREIGTHMGIRSTNGVNDHLRALERKGYLKREDMKSRALKPVNQNNDDELEALVAIPIIGRVQAGQPVMSNQNIEETITVDRFLIGKHKDVFALIVRDDSMIEEGIDEGDYVFVRKQMRAEYGQIAAVMIADRATIKYYKPTSTEIRLENANPDHDPIVIRHENFTPTQILGIVIGLYRSL